MLPLAERLRPRTLDEYIGQRHLIGEGCMLRSMIEQQNIPSMILWGPPGVGKTTLAEIIANTVKVPFYTLSAVTSGVKDVREVIDRAKQNTLFNQGGRPILFIDEIHRFSKSQQDSLLGAVERGIFTLIGATTENPSFEVIRPLLSRCQVYVLKPFEKDDLLQLLHRALTKDSYLSKLNIELKETGALLRYSGGDARRMLGILEIITSASEDSQRTVENGVPCSGVSCPSSLVITDALVEKQLEATPLAYDKLGDMHYDIISAFIKSIRGSDPQAALYWLARMIEGGEEPTFIARRLIISSTEDIGLANPNALLLANAAFDAVSKIGWPEARIPLAEATTYLALSPKSNSAYNGINSALATVKQTGNLPVPLHIRNAPTNLMADLGYADGYKYPHDYPGNYVPQQYLPDELQGTEFYVPQTSSAMETRLVDAWRKMTLLIITFFLFFLPAQASALCPAALSSVLIPENHDKLIAFFLHTENETDIDLAEILNQTDNNTLYLGKDKKVDNGNFAAIPKVKGLVKSQIQASFLFDRYLYSLDAAYLEHTALPYMVKVADELEKALQKTDEYGFYIVGKDDPTFDVTASIFFLRDIISACNILQLYQERVSTWMSMLAKLPPYRIDINEEFRRNLLGETANSRQNTDVPQLLGLFYRNDPIITRNYDILEACRTTIQTTIDYRHNTNKGYDHGLLQLALASAALGDSEKAYALLVESRNSWSALETSVARKQIAPVMINMLQQSYYSPETNKTYLNLLAATPQAWQKGELRGTLVRGGITLTELTWGETEGITATLVSQTDITLDIFIRGKHLHTIDLKSGEPYQFTAKKR